MEEFQAFHGESHLKLRVSQNSGGNGWLSINQSRDNTGAHERFATSSSSGSQGCSRSCHGKNEPGTLVCSLNVEEKNP